MKRFILSVILVMMIMMMTSRDRIYFFEYINGSCFLLLLSYDFRDFNRLLSGKSVPGET